MPENDWRKTKFRFHCYRSTGMVQSRSGEVNEAETTGCGSRVGAPFSNNSALAMTSLRITVDQVDRTVLCRPAHTDELSHGLYLLTAKIDIADLIDAAYKCPEYLMIVGPAIAEVRAAYRLLLHADFTQSAGKSPSWSELQHMSLRRHGFLRSFGLVPVALIPATRSIKLLPAALAASRGL